MYKDKKEDDVTVYQLPPSQYHDWIDYLKDEYLAFDEVRNRDQRLRGEIIHYILSFLANVSAKDEKTLLDTALLEAKIRFPHIEDFSQYQSRVENLLKSEKTRIFFDLKDSQIFTEKDIVNPQGHTKRLDRLIIKEDEVWVVDFKTSPDGKGRYEKQLQSYMKIVSELYPKHTIKGYLVYFDSLDVEEISNE